MKVEQYRATIQSDLFQKLDQLHTQPSKAKSVSFPISKVGKDTLLIVYQHIMIKIYRLFLSPFQHRYCLNMGSLWEHINWVNAVKIITQFLEFL